MEKNTLFVSLPESIGSINSTPFGKKDEEVPSAEVINTILNYSKALSIEQCKDGENFIEYVRN